jgi:tetratricopeptide (TPR) repeat protein
VRAGDRAALGGARTLLDRALIAMPDDPLLTHYAGYAAYREAILTMARGTTGADAERDRQAARTLLDRADSLLARSAERLPLAESFALRASVIGMQIGVGRNPAAAMWLGPKAGAAMDEALRRGPRNPRVQLLRGMSAFNTPSMWGGGAERAREYLAQAVTLFAADRPAPPLPGWGDAEAHLWLGRAWHALDQPDSARAAYARARAIEPDNQWLTRVLIPRLERGAPAAPAGERR